VKAGRQRLAFTIVELLIVLGIILILFAILAPALTAVRSQARALKCMSNVRQLGIILRLYALDNKDHYPTNISSPTPQYWNDAARLRPYIALPGIPMNSSSVFWCPADDDAQQSYAMNVWASSAADRSVTSLKTGELWPHHRVASPMLLLVAESWSYQMGTGAGWVPSPTIGTFGSSAAQRFGANGGIGPISAGRWGPVNSELAFYRHRQFGYAGAFTQPKGRVSICFDDGHAALCADSELIDPKSGTSLGLAAWSTLDYARN
jgi:type II secretory pathway pseudopilin PulG